MILDSPAVVVFSKFPNHFPASLLQNLGFQAQKFSIHCPADLCFTALSDRKWVWVYKAQVNDKLSWQSGLLVSSYMSVRNPFCSRTTTLRKSTPASGGRVVKWGRLTSSTPLKVSLKGSNSQTIQERELTHSFSHVFVFISVFPPFFLFTALSVSSQVVHYRCCSWPLPLTHTDCTVCVQY